MQRTILSIICAGLLSWGLSLGAMPSAAKEKEEPKAEAAKKKTEKKPAATKRATNKKTSSRLPAIYRDLVEDEQRSQITAAYSKYNAKIAKLREEIKSLTAERDKAIEDLLTAEQKNKLAKLREAKAKEKIAEK